MRETNEWRYKLCHCVNKIQNVAYLNIPFTYNDTDLFSLSACAWVRVVWLIRLHYGTWVQVVLDCTMEPHVFVEMFLVDFRFFYWPLRGCTGDLGKSRPLKTIPQRNWKQPQNGRQQSHCLPPPLSQLSIWATVQSPYLFSFVNITRRNWWSLLIIWNMFYSFT